MTSDDPVRFGAIEIRAGQRQLLVDGRQAAIGARAFDVLCALLQRRDRVVSRNELLDLVWGEVVVEENNLEVQISTLRKLLGPQAIATIPGRGYRFVAASDSAGPPRVAQGERLPAGNLPPRLSILLSRDEEAARIEALLSAHRLVTIVGAGGMGKTSLALAVAAALQPQLRDGAWLVELSDVADSERIVQAIAQAVRITLAIDRPPLETLLGVLACQEMLLVLDGCEHLVEAVGPVASAIEASAAGTRVLVTSQQLLNVPNETVFRLGPLSVPEADSTVDLEQFGAVRLFVERTRANRPEFALNTDNAGAVVDICRHLDGMPLAIELAAARVRHLGVHGVCDRLDLRFKVLRSGPRIAPRRHHTLAAMIEWSHALLSPAEQAVLRRLGVFVGGFSIELAQSVAAAEDIDEWEVLDALSGLADKSLVAVDAADPPRYRLLETTRAYALQRLAEAGEEAAMRSRHAHAVRAAFCQAEEDRFGENGTQTMTGFLDRLAPEIGNLRAALDWAIRQPGQAETAIRTIGAAGLLVSWLGLSLEFLHKALPLRPRLPDVSEVARASFLIALVYLGDLGRLSGVECIEAAAQAEAYCRRAGERRRLLHGKYVLGWELMRGRHWDQARATCEQMRGLERLGDPAWLRAMSLNLEANLHMNEGRMEAALDALHVQQRLLAHATGEEIGVLRCFNNLANVLNCLCRHDEAIAAARAAIDCAAQHRFATIGYTLFQLLHAESALGRLDDAAATVRRGLPVWRRDGMLMFGASHLALWLAASARWSGAAKLDAAARCGADRSGVANSPVRRQASEWTQSLLQAAGCDPAQLAEWASTGAALDDDAIAALCVHFSEARPVG